MSYYSFMNSVDAQVEKTQKCNGYSAFKEDVSKLKQDNQGCGLSAIVAHDWLKKICKLKNDELLEYVNSYVLGTLNAWYLYK